MRIALLSGEYPPQPGGVGDYTARLGQALVERGHDIVVFTIADGRFQIVDLAGSNPNLQSTIYNLIGAGAVGAPFVPRWNTAGQIFSTSNTKPAPMACTRRSICCQGSCGGCDGARVSSSPRTICCCPICFQKLARCAAGSCAACWPTPTRWW